MLEESTSEVLPWDLLGWQPTISVKVAVIKLCWEGAVGASCSCTYKLVLVTSAISKVLFSGGLTGAGQPSCPWPNLHNECVPAATTSLPPAGQSQAWWKTLLMLTLNGGKCQ